MLVYFVAMVKMGILINLSLILTYTNGAREDCALEIGITKAFRTCLKDYTDFQAKISEEGLLKQGVIEPLLCSNNSKRAIKCMMEYYFQCPDVISNSANSRKLLKVFESTCLPVCTVEVSSTPEFRTNIEKYKELEKKISMWSGEITNICSEDNIQTMFSLAYYLYECPSLQMYIGGSTTAQQLSKILFQRCSPERDLPAAKPKTCPSALRCVLLLFSNYVQVFFAEVKTPYRKLQKQVGFFCGKTGNLFKECLLDSLPEYGSCEVIVPRSRSTLNHVFSMSDARNQSFNGFLEKECSAFPVDFAENTCLATRLDNEDFVQCVDDFDDQFNSSVSKTSCEYYQSSLRCLQTHVTNHCGDHYLPAFQRAMQLFLSEMTSKECHTEVKAITPGSRPSRMDFVGSSTDCFGKYCEKRCGTVLPHCRVDCHLHCKGIMSEPGGSGPCNLDHAERKQSLANKCINERRRRDQENYYFEELAEIISASIADMSSSFSVKPEKCAILQETVKQIKQLKQRKPSGGDTAVQQSQVSSSKPNILADDFLGPLLLEALDGFLFVVNCQGKVEFVSDNVTQFLKYTQDDVIGKSVYNIIHVGDHAQFSNSLLPMSVGSGINWTEKLSGKGKIFNCRLLIKPPCDDDDLEAKQTYVSQYETMQISSSLHPDSFTDAAENSESNPSLVCVARRLPLAEKTKAMLGVEQFTTKLDLNGKIIGCDISGIAPGRFNQPDFVGQKIQDFCHANDVQQISKHLQEVISCGHNTSAVYRFKLQEKRYVFVQTKSNLFQNRVNGNAEFIMSVHSIIRECDSEDEKGSASTSLMKAIIGPSINQQNQSKSTTAISSVNTSIANMALVGNAMLSQMNTGSFRGLNDNISEELIRETSTWDSQISDSNLSSFDNENNNVNFNFQNSSISSTTTSFSSPIWTNSNVSNLELSKVQQLQRSLSTSSALQNPTSAAIAATMAAVVSKRPVALTQFPQRSSSLDHGQGQGMVQGQRSPGYAQSPGSRSGGFQLPSQRGPPSFNRRSPAASPNPHGQGNFNVPFPRTPSPMLSPSPGLNMNNSGWGHQAMLSQTGSSLHGSHQTSFENQSGLSAQERLFQQINGFESLVSGEKKVNRSGKLCQLLTQHSPPTSSQKSAPGTPKSARSRHNSRQGLMEMSPADSRQSPQPGPGQSPPEKPQSTSNDDGEHVVQTESKDANRLLKTLLSQPDDEYEEPLRNEPKKEESAEAQAVQQDPSGVDMERNEAEAKKPNNILLKQLLSTDDESYFKEVKKEGLTQIENSSLIPKLFDETKKDNCRSAPAESTSADSDLRQRHRSEPQEPQSTTSHSHPMPPLSSPLTSPTAQSFSQSQSSGVDTSLIKGLFNVSTNTSVNLQFSVSNSLYSSGNVNINNSVNTSNVAGHSGGAFTSHLLSVSSSSDMANSSSKDKSIDKLLHMLWEGETDNNSDEHRETVKTHLNNLKRKHDLMEASSEPDNFTSQSVSGSGGSLTTSSASKLSRENALLSQLLSKRSGDEVEFVVSTRSIQPSGVPQSRYPPNLATKLLKVHPSSASINVQESDKRQKMNDGVPSSSTLERALTSSQKVDGILPSSSPVDPNNSGFSQNSNSGFSNISSDISSSQFKEQYSELQSMLQSVSEDRSVATEVDLNDNSDHVLAQILQQADDLERDVSYRSLSGSNNNSVTNQSSQKSSQDSGNSLVSAQISGLVPGMGNSNYNQNSVSSGTMAGTTSTPPVDIIQQLEQVLNESIDIDSLLGSSSSLIGANNSAMDMNDQLAIDAIQKQLMTDLPGQSLSGTPPSNGSMSQLQNSLTRQRFMQASLADQQQQGPVAGSQMQQQQQTGMLGNQPGQLTAMSGQFSQNAVRQALSSQVRALQQPGYVPNPQAPSFPTQGQRLPHPQGPLGSALPSPTQRPMFPNSNPNSTAMQVRQSLLQQQKMKQLRERDKQRLQQQDRQKMLLQQQRSFGGQQFPGQRFPPDSLTMGSGGGIVQFPENLAELMNSGSAPNVTLQRNQIPGPMSPRFAQGIQQPPQSPNMGSLMPPVSQVSPNFSPPQQQQQQWNLRQGQASMGMPTNQTQSQYRHRSLSGGTMQTNPQRFPDSQYPGNQAMAGLFSSQQQQQQQQQQQLYQQARGNQLQRQMSMPGRGSPRASQSPFGSSDPLLMSPHNVSPNSIRGAGGQQQVSPSYSQQGGLGNSYGQTSMTSPSSSMTSPQFSQNQRLLDIDLSLFDNSKKPPDVPLSVNTPASTHFVKREIRNLCNARTERQLQSQMLPPQQSPHYIHQQQQQLPQPMDQESSELPLDILEQINEMSQEHGTSLQQQQQHTYKEELVVPKKREEAKTRYETLQALASSSDQDEKATNLFRKQLTAQQKMRLAGGEKMPPNYVEPKQVNVVQNEPRVPVDEIKPANQKDSLLQQLLSD